MSDKKKLFEEITNTIAVLVDNDVDIVALCNDKLGSKLNAVDNSITQISHKQELPFFTVNKGEETHFFNRGTSNGSKSEFPIQVVLFGSFRANQTSNNEFVLPTGAEIVVNGIKTFTPSDTMREIARAIGYIIDEKLSCTIPQIRVEKFSVYSEGYFDREDGVVGSVLNLDLYLENRGYN